MPLSAVKCSLTLRVTSFTMDTIATPTAVQSEAYISTIALFTLFASSPKEERCHLRLPTTWRDVWSELVALKKIQNDSEDKQILQSIRNIVQSNIPRADGDEDTDLTPQSLQPVKKEVEKSSDKTREQVASDPERLKDGWARKISSSTYQRMFSSRIKLPIWNFKDDILGALDRNQVIIICGETGCGKSTQVPSFILEQEMMAGRECRVYITEPRRISAISLAQRVSEELGEYKNDIGTRNSDVGYAIRLESKVNDQTRLVYA
jgi:ATP-dependent RNA helicase DHX29